MYCKISTYSTITLTQICGALRWRGFEKRRFWRLVARKNLSLPFAEECVCWERFVIRSGFQRRFPYGCDIWIVFQRSFPAGECVSGSRAGEGEGPRGIRTGMDWNNIPGGTMSQSRVILKSYWSATDILVRERVV